MATNLLSYNYEDEEYIDMEVSSSSSSLTSPPKSREFEFQIQMASSSISQEGAEISTSSPADELFYKGKLLPLHLPPRLQMVKALLQNATFQTAKQSLKEEEQQELEEEQFITISTPMDQSCNISPSESRRVSTELNPDEYFFQWSTELTGFIGDHPKKFYYPWSKKLRLIKQSLISQKLRASRAYLKSLFNKSGCASNGSSCAKQAVEEVGDNDNDKHFLSKYLKVTKKCGYGQIQTGKYPTLASVLKGIEEQRSEDSFDNSCSHRRSFSGAIKRKCSSSSASSSSGSASASATSSSSSSFNYSSGIYELQLSKRSSSADSELEGSIEAAIDHCKKSQQLFNSRIAFNESLFPHSVS